MRPTSNSNPVIMSTHTSIKSMHISEAEKHKFSTTPHITPEWPSIIGSRCPIHPCRIQAIPVNNSELRKTPASYTGSKSKSATIESYPTTVQQKKTKQRFQARPTFYNCKTFNKNLASYLR